ncbi:MAG: NusA-like transcription termination signal-binding factor [Candidatus Aenigmarchaeota archaeon]|nr:NusA-like transcription termination signal-binding factor [Candidatus Aenigmarchaeota archaeon]
MKVTLDMSAIKTIALFQEVTQANVLDYYENDDEIFFVVPEGQVGFVLGKDGSKIKRAENRFKKRIKIFEYSDDMEQFIRNMIPETQDISINDGNVRVRIKPADRSRIIGKGGIRARAMEYFIKRLHKAESLKVV